MAREKILQGSHGERGQSIILVAVCIVSLLAMAALAVDVVTLYVAKGEVQHAADAAALAGAKAFVESSLTTDTSNGTLQTLAQQIAGGYITEALKQNLVSGAQATLVSPTPTYAFNPGLGNPTITVKIQRTNLPIFFARIWSSNLVSVSATASAEAYNPSNSQTAGTPMWVGPQCVKPLLLRNTGGRGTAPPPKQIPTFITTTDGTMSTIPPTKLIGLEFVLSYGACPAGVPCVRYKPQIAQSTHNFPSSCASGPDYRQSIESCDGLVYNFPQCGASATPAVVNQFGDPSSDTELGTECLIHASGPGLNNGQDSLDASNYLSSGDPMQFAAGTYTGSHFVDSTAAQIGPNALITTSDSIITLPIYDDTASSPVTFPNVNIVGFLQAFVNFTDPSYLDVTILNVVGCGSTPSAVPAISGGGISPIPVRLITPGG
jgi:Flp pilus assembly protein TadG